MNDEQNTFRLMGSYFLSTEIVDIPDILRDFNTYADQFSEFDMLDCECEVQFLTGTERALLFNPLSCCNFLRWTASDFLILEPHRLYWLPACEEQLLLDVSENELKIASVRCSDTEELLRPYVLRETDENSMFAFELKRADRLAQEVFRTEATVTTTVEGWHRETNRLAVQY